MDFLCIFCLVFAMPLCASVYMCLVVPLHPYLHKLLFENFKRVVWFGSLRRSQDFSVVSERVFLGWISS